MIRKHRIAVAATVILGASGLLSAVALAGTGSSPDTKVEQHDSVASLDTGSSTVDGIDEVGTANDTQVDVADGPDAENDANVQEGDDNGENADVNEGDNNVQEGDNDDDSSHADGANDSKATGGHHDSSVDEHKSDNDGSSDDND